MVVRGACCWLGTVIRGWVVVVRDGGLPFVGGGWSFVVGDGCSCWGLVVRVGDWSFMVGGWSYVVGDGRSWMGVVVRGGGSLFVVVWVCGVVVRVGSLSVWGVVFRKGPLSSMCGMWSSVGGSLSSVGGAWSSVGGRCRPCVRCGRPWGFVVVRAWGVVVR